MLYTITASPNGLSALPIFSEQQVNDVLEIRGMVHMSRYQAQVAIEYLSQPVFKYGETQPRWKEICAIKRLRTGQFTLGIDDKLSLYDHLMDYAKERLEFVLENDIERFESSALTLYSMDIDAYDPDHLEIRYLTPMRFSVISRSGNRRELVAAYRMSHQDALTLTYLPAG